ncbi:disulfide bond formation protein B [Oleiagrimonas sp. C23AA]|uniref:disulfide bond formation protein B n=1 Tax=Oleiagrimonas sp. C23AA TaxID=2719047 RepID=UPI0014216739|nr:disulfide bond formation protein B [Oleiagrimonas sp. C23AA]NII11634.1 disulfide bond formation protein B [Oleiagrimonas sp. C23AA]
MTRLLTSFRAICLAGFVICAALIAFALYAQYQLGMDPCPLCILQRVVFIGLGLLFLVAGAHGPRAWGRWVWAGLIALVAAIGVGISWRHLWIQSLPPDQVPSCGAPLGYMLETRGANGGFVGVLVKVLSGSGECAKVQPILGLSMPWWALIWFVILGVAVLWAAARARR